MSFSGLSFLATTLLWWWMAAVAIGFVVGWATLGRARGAASSQGTSWVAWFVLLGIGVIISYLQILRGRAGLWFDMAVLFATMYFIGCCLGSFLRLIVSGPAKETAPAVSLAGSGRPSRSIAPAKPFPVTTETIKPYQWQASRDGKVLTLTGYVPSLEVKTRIMMASKGLLPKLTVTDRLQLGAGAPSSLETLAGAAFAHLAKLETGVASLVDGLYTLTGTAPNAAGKAAIEKMVGSLPQGFTLAKADIGVRGELTAPQTVEMTPVAPLNEPAIVSVPEQILAAPVPTAVDKPEGLAGPRGGTADDLKRIRGIGKQNESRLHELGIWHFDQIASWTPQQVAWVGHFLAFPGRIEREDWVTQARSLAGGNDTDFSKRVDKGLVATSRGDMAEPAAAQPQSTAQTVASAERPKNALDAPRNGKPDTLRYIKGVSSETEFKLHALGLFHYDQIAQLSNDELGTIAAGFGMPGKALDDNWKGEAAMLAIGSDTDHSKAMKAEAASLKTVVPRKK